jgi:mono/diheme cytochrome c family protein
LGTAKAPSLREVRKQLSADQTHTQIHDGGKTMPPFGEALTEAQIAALVDFLHSKDGWKLVEATAGK